MEIEIFVERERGDQVAQTIDLNFPPLVGDLIDIYVDWLGSNTQLEIIKREFDATKLEDIKLKLYTRPTKQ